MKVNTKYCIKNYFFLTRKVRMFDLQLRKSQIVYFTRRVECFCKFVNSHLKQKSVFVTNIENRR